MARFSEYTDEELRDEYAAQKQLMSGKGRKSNAGMIRLTDLEDEIAERAKKEKGEQR